MPTLAQRVLALVSETPGLTDRQLTDILLGTETGQQAVNQAARRLATKGSIVRRNRPDGKIGNYEGATPEAKPTPIAETDIDEGASEQDGLGEDEVKRYLKRWLEADGWTVQVRWGRDRGTDIEARLGGQLWIIEAKGCGSLNAMRVNYFLSMLGETLQRMVEPTARYSIALPDMQQYSRLWAQLPTLAKSRTQITALFVSSAGDVRQES